MKYFKELKRGEAFKCLETCYIKISDDTASNAICLHNGHRVTFCDNAGVCPIELRYVIDGVDLAIPRRDGI